MGQHCQSSSREDIEDGIEEGGHLEHVEKDCMGQEDCRQGGKGEHERFRASPAYGCQEKPCQGGSQGLEEDQEVNVSIRRTNVLQPHARMRRWTGWTGSPRKSATK